MYSNRFMKLSRSEQYLSICKRTIYVLGIYLLSFGYRQIYNSIILHEDVCQKFNYVDKRTLIIKYVPIEKDE